MSDSKQSLTPWELRTEATLASALWVLDGETRLPADAERRHDVTGEAGRGRVGRTGLRGVCVSGGVSEPELPALSRRGSRGIRREFRRSTVLARSQRL